MPELPVDLWLKHEDIGEGDLEVTFRDKGKIKPKEETGFDHNTFEIGVTLPNGDKRIWTMNVTSQRAVAQTYGTNSDNWVGKKAVVYARLQKVGKDDKWVIYARVPKAES